MSIKIKGANANNLKNIDLEIEECHTVFTGVSGSGKSSLLFDTIYHEARRRLFAMFRINNEIAQLSPTEVQSINGLKPAIAIIQNVKNRNPNSTLATATGIHVLLRILYANYGVQHCSKCGTPFHLRSEDKIVEGIVKLSQEERIEIHARILNKVKGSHRSLLRLLYTDFPEYEFIVNGKNSKPHSLEKNQSHTITVRLNKNFNNITLAKVREIIKVTKQFGVGFLMLSRLDHGKTYILPFKRICPECNGIIGKLEPPLFNKNCPFCNGKGCNNCEKTGMHPIAAATTWQGYTFQNIMGLSLEEFWRLINRDNLLPASGEAIHKELIKKCASLLAIGLGYINLDRLSPTLSRGEYQRLQIARAMANDLEDVMYLLDEPTIGLHPAEIREILPTIGKLKGTVLTIEHDKQAILSADRCIELGPGAGENGGKVTYIGNPSSLPGMDDVILTKRYPVKPTSFIDVKGAKIRNLKNIDISIPIRCLTVIAGVSGSGKSTLVEDVLLPSFIKNKTVACKAISSPIKKVMFVNQAPIGLNTRSNPATYTQLFNDIREYFAWQTGLSVSDFVPSPGKGACVYCNGLGEKEVKMRYLPSTWLKCPVCNGSRYNKEIMSNMIFIGERGLSIADFLDLQVSKVWSLVVNGTLSLHDFPKAESFKAKLQALIDVGLSYIKLGQPAPTLSGGEAQRVKLAKILGQRMASEMLLIFDEPTTGLHKKDVERILLIFDRLKEKGITVLVIEHNVDVIRHGDWLIELGPGSGPAGGDLMFMGPPEELASSGTKTALSLQEELFKSQAVAPCKKESNSIYVNNAYANNLKNISLTVPKNEMVVITGVSGSGKSTLVRDVIEAEAKRRFLETLTTYERYNIHETKGSDVESISGLGLACTIAPEKWMYSPRSTIGTITRIYETLGILYARIGNRNCPNCSILMKNVQDGWYCSHCENHYPYPDPKSFLPSSYTGACTVCQGVGTVQHLNENKIIVQIDKPLLKGAMYSPGFFPKGFLGKPGNSGYYLVRAFAKRYGFDPEYTPWKDMSKEAKQKFLFGDEKPMTVRFENTKGKAYTQILPFPGFQGWVINWDIGGTYTDRLCCPGCGGSGLKPEFNEITLLGYNIHELCQISIEELNIVLKDTKEKAISIPLLRKVWYSLEQKLQFMLQTGLSYVNLGRFSSTLSAGEAQRIKLTTLLENEMNGLLVLLDEPTRGMHSTEVSNLIDALIKIKTRGNTLIVVEHDTNVMQAADTMIEIGPKAGNHGGEIVASGKLEQLLQLDTVTTKWIKSPYPYVKRTRRQPKGFVTIVNATENNLKIEKLDIPLGTLTGICGISGSGKSTLITDTIARSQIKRKQTTSVSYELMATGHYESIIGIPKKVVMVDQSKVDITNIARYIGIDKLLIEIYQSNEASFVKGLNQYSYKKNCTECGGKGNQKVDMEFMEVIHVPCEACNGTGYGLEAWEVKIKGYSYPKLFQMNLEELHQLWAEHDKIDRILGSIEEVGLSYLLLGQPPHSLSSGEVQRLKLAMALLKKERSGTLYILDEPTVGLHNEDVQLLINVLNKLVEKGNSLWVVEHHMNMLASCDYLIELGPKGGPQGGRIIAQGTPEQMSQFNTPTGKELEVILK